MISMKIPPSNPCFLEVFWHNYLLQMTSPRPLMQLLEDNQHQVKMVYYKHLADSSVLDPCRSHHAIFFFQQPYLCMDVLFAGRANKKMSSRLTDSGDILTCDQLFYRKGDHGRSERQV